MLSKLWARIRANYYFAHHTNFHKHPLLSRLMCWCGRHDYEADGVEVEPDAPSFTDRVSVRLVCFYCGQEKSSGFTNIGKDKRLMSVPVKRKVDK